MIPSKRLIFLFVFLLSISFALPALAAVPTWALPRYFYGDTVKVTGDLTNSGLAKDDNMRYAIITKVSAAFRENIVSNEIRHMEQLDNYSLQEALPTDDFYQRDGYVLIPIASTTAIREVVQNANGNPDYVLNTIQQYREGDYGFYKIDRLPAISVAQLVTLSGGIFNTKTYNFGQPINSEDDHGTLVFDTSPWPKIDVAKTESGQLVVDFTTYGQNGLHQPKVLATNGTNTVTVADYGRTDKKVFHQVLQKPMADIESQLGADNLKIIVEDGYGRTAEAMLNARDNLLIIQDSFSITPNQPQKPDTAAQIRFKVKNESANTYNPELIWKWEPNKANYLTLENFKPGEVREITIDTHYPYEDMKFIGHINYGRTEPPDEVNWDDNRGEWLVKVALPNLKVENLKLTPNPAKPNDSVKQSAEVTNQSDETVSTPLVWKVDGATKRTDKITLSPGQTKTVTGPTFAAPMKDVAVSATINPNHDSPPNESNYSDNTTSQTLNVNGEKNIGVTISKAPDVMDADKHYNATITVFNSGYTTETFTLSVKQPYTVSVKQECDNFGDNCYWINEEGTAHLQQQFTLKPKETKSVSFDGFSGDDLNDEKHTNYDITISASVTRLPGEKTYADNSASKTIPVNPYEMPPLELHLEK